MPPLLLLLLLLLLLVVEPALIVAPLPPGTHEPTYVRIVTYPGGGARLCRVCLVLERRFVARLVRKTRFFHLDGDDGKFDTTLTNIFFTAHACHAPFLNMASDK